MKHILSKSTIAEKANVLVFEILQTDDKYVKFYAKQRIA